MCDREEEKERETERQREISTKECAFDVYLLSFITNVACQAYVCACVCVSQMSRGGSKEEAVWRAQCSTNKHLSFINKTRPSWCRLLRSAEENRSLVQLGGMS